MHISLLSGLLPLVAGLPASIRVSVAGAGGRSIPPELNGCHFSPLDHQLFTLYSQMVYDESFEQILGGLSKQGPGDTVSLGWSNLSRTGASWRVDPASAYNGNVSVVLRAAEGLVGRAGVAARGMYHQGYVLEQGRDYEGYLAVKADRPAWLWVALEDWPTNASSGVPLAARRIQVPGTGEWSKIDFSLTPNRSTGCRPFPFGQAPLDCSIPDSQHRAPANATASCEWCGGTLTVWTEGPAVSIDQVMLQPGPWGRYRGLPVHAAPAEWLERMGPRMLRYGGTFTETVQGSWKSSRGPAWLRPPCTAGKAEGGRGGCHLTKLARWSRGWGVIEAMQLCEGMGVLCVVGLARAESVQSMADFVEYAYGNQSTSWGARRAADGHPAPYPAMAIQVSNEACMCSFVDDFAQKAAAMEAVARISGMAGRLRYVTGSYLGITSAASKCPGSPNTTDTVLRQVAAAGLCDQLWIDTHITPGTNGDPGTATLAAELARMSLAAGCQGARLAVLEQNKCNNHFERALQNAGAAAGLAGIPNLAAAATSQCWSDAAHADGCGEGHILSMPSQTWAAAPYYASQMVYRSFQPTEAAVSVTPIASTAGSNLTVFAAVSNASLVLRVLNPNNVSVQASIGIDGVAVVPTVRVETLVSPLSGTAEYSLFSGGWNSPTHPLFIAPKKSTCSWGASTYTLPEQSFVVLTFDLADK